MANEIGKAVVGLTGMLKKADLSVYHHPIEPTEYPAVVLKFTGSEDGSVGGQNIEGEIQAMIFVANPFSEEGTEELYRILSPNGSGSFKEAIDDDYTWGGNVSIGWLTEIEEPEVETLPSGAVVWQTEATLRFRT